MGGFVPPPAWTEIASQLRQSQQVTLDANGNGVLYFTPSSGNQRWVVSTVTVQTNQAATATVVPVATMAMNAHDLATMAAGALVGASWSGNNDTWTGAQDVGPCDTLAILFSAPPGASGSSLAGVIANAVVRGTSYTRRA